MLKPKYNKKQNKKTKRQEIYPNNNKFSKNKRYSKIKM